MPKMYAIENGKGLLGKTIAYAEMEVSTKDLLIIATTDGGVYLGHFEEDYTCDDEQMFRLSPLSGDRAERRMFQQKYIQKRLIYAKAFTQEEVDEFLTEQLAKREKEIEDHKKRQEENERKLFEQLKAKFEVQS